MDGHTPPQDVATAAQRALRWIEEGRQGSGFTEVGHHRAQQLGAREAISDDDVKRMKNYFSRHQHDAEAPGFTRGDEGYPSAGRVAWDAWGGDPGRAWVQQKQFDDL